jgi:ABC-2 type transport system ATP-binding protein
VPGPVGTGVIGSVAVPMSPQVTTAPLSARRAGPSPTPAGADVEPVVQAAGVWKRWGQTVALADATLTIGPGITGLLGANGAGKTTLLGLLLGLQPPDQGQLRVLGLDPTKAGPDVRERVGYSPEHHLVPPDVKALDFVRHIAELHGLPTRDANARASDALWQVGLGEERVRPIGTMSTGQRQRVKLAQAIVHDPRVVLLDEPTEGLDPVQRDEMLRLIGRIGTEFGIHVLLSSHVLDEVERVCDHAVILHAGQVIRAGRLEDLRHGGAGLVVEIEGDPTAFIQTLVAEGCKVGRDGTQIFVEGPDHVFDLVRDSLADSEIALRRLAPRTLSLEEVFLGAGPQGPQAPPATAS